ncbi:MAG: glycosyltransferase [Verrucomicrobiota bacterium]
MKVAIVSSCFGSYGGIEAFVLALAKSLQKEGRCSPSVIWKQAGAFELSDELIRRSQESGVPFQFVQPRSRALWKAIQNSDFVHAQNSPPDVVFFSKLQGKPLALTIHNRRMSEHRWKSTIWHRMQQWADRRWYNSEFVRQTWEGKSLKAGSRVIPTVSELPEGEIPISSRKGFCFASRWIPNKGIEVLLEAYQRGSFDPSRWPLQMIGEGPLFLSLRRKYETTLGVIFHGFVSESEKADLIRNSRWMVIPPHTQEDLGLTAIEARNVGVPCVATRDGGLPEAAGTSAILCEPGNVDALLQALHEATGISESDYEKRSQESKSSLKHFLMPLSNYFQLYQEMVKA